MESDIDQMLELMRRTFRDFEAAIPNKPKLLKLPYGGRAYRFVEKDIFQAIIQKLAHVQSAVRAARVLLDHGFVQEQAALQRVVDEANEDVLFLVYAVTNDCITDLHQRFLDAFWQEEFDESGDPVSSDQKRPMIPRKKIQAYIASVEGAPMDPSRGQAVARTLHKAYSGFVHGASPHIMDRYGGKPPRFHIDGMLGTSRKEEHKQDFWNYVYRTHLSHIFVAKALGASKHIDILVAHLKRFEEIAGKDYAM